MYIYIYTHTHTHIYIYTHTFVYIYKYAYITDTHTRVDPQNQTDDGELMLTLKGALQLLSKRHKYIRFAHAHERVLW